MGVKKLYEKEERMDERGENEEEYDGIKIVDGKHVILTAVELKARKSERKKKIHNSFQEGKTSHPRIAHGQRCPMPCLE